MLVTKKLISFRFYDGNTALVEIISALLFLSAYTLSPLFFTFIVIQKCSLRLAHSLVQLLTFKTVARQKL